MSFCSHPLGNISKFPEIFLLSSASDLSWHKQCGASDTGTLFRYARTWVEQHGWPWYILSAGYGLLDPLRIIRPYDHRFRGPAPSEWVEAVWTALLERYAGRQVHFEVLAGRFCRDKLVQRIEDYAGWTVEVPLAGLGIGRQIAWLKANTTR